MKLSRLELYTLINCVWDCERLLRTSERHRKRLGPDGPMGTKELQEMMDKLSKKLVDAFKEADD